MGTHFRKTRPKADFNVNDGHMGRMRVIEHADGTSQKCVLVILGIDRDDGGLAVHIEDGSVSGINAERVRHENSTESRQALLPNSILRFERQRFFLTGSRKPPIC